jgi:hypothetical protein
MLGGRGRAEIGRRVNIVTVGGLSSALLVGPIIGGLGRLVVPEQAADRLPVHDPDRHRWGCGRHAIARATDL